MNPPVRMKSMVRINSAVTNFLVGFLHQTSRKEIA
ncbi:hypothetical protein CUMW_161480 [Citrus unshiu]|uniref:Uncharacterized protein n=1 Tax=Citrus unshiu TaxID=55188 RepID=A0A2H5PRR0_CITUN|nr:hypothetical protein CUMW_161480 [Citrus unshiu]